MGCCGSALGFHQLKMQFQASTIGPTRAIADAPIRRLSDRALPAIDQDSARKLALWEP